jgi:hypothetical protein
MATLTNESFSRDEEIELLIPEVEQETHRRRRRRAAKAGVLMIAVTVVAAIALVLAGLAGAGGNPGTDSGGAGVVPLAVAETLRPVGFPPSAADVSFRNVSCASGVACIVVGEVQTRVSVSEAAWRYEGGSWHRLPSPLWTNRDGPGPLSCPTTSFCVMASNHWGSFRGAQLHASVQVFEHGSWQEVGTPSPLHSRNDTLQAIDCVSTSWCMATGIAWVHTWQVAYADVLIDRRWTLLSVPTSPGGNEPYSASIGGVSCTSTTFCLAVGYAQEQTATIATAASYDGRTWTAVPVPRLPNSELGRPGEICYGKKCTKLPWAQALTGVACASPTDCTASGSFDASVVSEQLGGSFVMHYNGTAISKVLLFAKGPMFGHPGGSLGGIACAAAARCASFVVGFNYIHALFGPTSQNAVQLGGGRWFTSSWRYEKRLLPQPADISCLRNGRCLIVGRVEVLVPGGSNDYPGGRWIPLALQASTR